MAGSNDPHNDKVEAVSAEMAIKRGRLATAQAIKELKEFGETEITPEMRESGAIITTKIILRPNRTERT